MKVIQKISENKGIEWDKNHAEIAGYQHHDGLWFGNESCVRIRFWGRQFKLFSS